MELKPGYKQTEVGVIPGDWEVLELEETAKVVDSLHQTPSFSEDGYPMVRVTDIKTGNLSFNGALKVCETVFAEFTKNYKPKRGDIVLSRVGSYGVSSFVETDEPFCMGQNTVVLQPKLPARFLYYVLNSQRIRQQIEDGSYGSGYKSLSLKNIKELLIPLPPTKTEQCSIAVALGDVDALIGALDRLIVKKRDLKQAAMQQLLTGQTRLPRFSGEWEVKRLGDVFSISAGKSKSAYVVNGGRFWVVDMGSVSRDGRLIVSKGTNYQGDFLKVGDLVMPKDDIGGGNIIGKVGYIDADDTYVLGDHVYCLRAIVGSPLFLSYVINGHQTNNALRKKVIGSAQLGLGRKSVEEQEIPFPLPSEQTAIAAVFSDMDNEIAALEARRDKTRALKQGMMQELLTGRTRLV
jgi:type I restriction enzyme S subunit